MIIESWVLWTLLAASMQSVRTAGQKILAGEVSAEAATMVRYLFGLPFAALYLAFNLSGRTGAAPSPGSEFLVSGLLAGILQIVATVLLIRLFSLRNFAVGSTYVRTEIILTALIGAAFFTEEISPTGWFAIVLCVAGLVLVNIARTGTFHSLWNRSAAYGLGSGLAFALTSLFLRRASLSLGLDDPVVAASMTLCYMVLVQTVLTMAWVFVKSRHEIARVFVRWRASLFIGITSVIGSAGWFTAMTLESASYVKTLGQVEFLVTLSISWFYFHERPHRLEIAGMAVIVVSVMVLLTA